MQRINHHSEKERRARYGERNSRRGSSKEWGKEDVCCIESTIRSPNELTIIAIEGKVVHRLKSQIHILTFHFKCLFAPDGVGNLTRHHPTLQHPIFAMEFQAAAAKLKNRCTFGPDLVSNELRSMLTSQKTSQCVVDLSNLLFDPLNAALEGSIHLSALGTGTLNALQ